MFNKSNVNFVIDALMSLCMMAMAGIGLLIKYVLLPGSEAQVKYGTKVNLYLFGLDRHEWGTIHLIIGFVLGGLLVLHIVLQWTQILNVYRKLISGQTPRRIIAVVFIIISLVLVVFPLVVKPEVQEFERGGGGGRGRSYLEERPETPNILKELTAMPAGKPQVHDTD